MAYGIIALLIIAIIVSLLLMKKDYLGLTLAAYGISLFLAIFSIVFLAIALIDVVEISDEKQVISEAETHIVSYEAKLMEILVLTGNEDLVDPSDKMQSFVEAPKKSLELQKNVYYVSTLESYTLAHGLIKYAKSTIARDKKVLHTLFFIGGSNE